MTIHTLMPGEVWRYVTLAGYIISGDEHILDEEDWEFVYEIQGRFPESYGE